MAEPPGLPDEARSIEEGGSAGLCLVQAGPPSDVRLSGSSYGATAGSGSDKSDREPARGNSAGSISSLPDLTERLKQAGIYGEYYAYREKYLQWRRGGAQGAAGELTAEAIAQRPDPGMFEFWYPSPSIFKWRFTIAYWKGILFLIGSLLFTFNACLDYWGGPGGHQMKTNPNLIGSVFFSLGCYASYLQLINISTDKEERVNYLLPDFEEVASRISSDSVIGTIAYLVGALLFNVGTSTALYQQLSPHTERVFLDWPNLLGSVCFVIGGICEFTHNGIFTRGGATYRQPVFWVAQIDLAGIICFLLGSVPPFAFPDWSCNAKFVAFNFGLGAALFIVSSILMIVMWRANDFGLSLLKQLNFAMQVNAQVSIARPPGSSQSGNDEPPVGVRIHLPHGASGDALREQQSGKKTFSLRVTVFICLYCWFAFVAIMNSLCKEQWYLHSNVRHIMRHVLDLATQLFIVMLITLVLVLHSAVTDVPDEQPFHCALITLRVVLFCGAVIQTVMFVAFFLNPHYDDDTPLL